MAVYTYTTEVVSPVLRISSPANHLFGLVSYSYSPDSSIYVGGDDFGFISDIISESEDYGSVAETATLYDDYAYITITTKPSYGLIRNIVSTSIIGFGLKSVGGVEFALQGGSYEGFGSPYIGYGGLTRISGELSKESFVPATEVGSGTLFNFISKEERRTYSYNGSSVVLKVDEDFGSITTLHTESADYGVVSEVVNTPGSEDYGLITTSDGRPYGSLGFVGDASKTVIFSLTAFVGGSLFGFGGAAEATVPFIPLENGLFKFTGGLEKQSFVQSTYIGSGSLFNFITKEERRTYSYNSSATIEKSDDDFGFISAVASEQDDYGYITTFATGVNSEDYGSIITSDQRPYGTLSFVGSNAELTRFRLRYIGSGSLFGFGGAAEATVPFIPLENGLFKFSGAATQSSTPATHVGSGTLFNFITKEERRTYSYNSSSIIVKSDSDYGFISQINTESEDYGFITDFASGVYSEDFGLLTTSDQRPYGVLRFAGEPGIKFQVRVFGSGSLFTFVSGTETAGVKPPVSGLFKFSGTSTEKTIPNYVGSGSLFNFITKEERRTYSYNETSVVGEGIIDDYGIISENHFISSDYGFVSELHSPPGDDYGYITAQIPPTKKPFGLFSIAGAATQSSSPATHVGSGSLFTFISGTETAGVKPPVSGLFKFSGTVIEKNVPNFVGSGSLFNFITKEERRTYSYNGSSIILKVDVDYGFISEAHQDAEDYGDVSNNIISSSEDYGLLTTSDQRPYGVLRFAGEGRLRSSVGKLRFPFVLPTYFIEAPWMAKTSPWVVNQSDFLPFFRSKSSA